MSSNESENILRNLVKDVEVHEICLKMLEAALREVDERGIHPKAHTDVITMAILNLANCLDEEKQQFSFEELDPDEPEEAQDVDSASQPVTSGSLPPAPGTLIAASTDLNGNGVTQTVSATGQGVHTRFLYSKEPATSHVASISASVLAKRVDKGKGKATDLDNSDSEYDPARDVLSVLPKLNKRARGDDGDEARAVRNTFKRPNKSESQPNPGPSCPHAHPRGPCCESTFYARRPDEDVQARGKLVKVSLKRSRVLETSSSASTPTLSISAPAVSLSAVASSSTIVRSPSSASSVASNATAVYSPPASPKPMQLIFPSRTRPRGLCREYAFYIPRTDASTSSSTFASPPAVSSTSTCTPNISAYVPAPVPAAASAPVSVPVTSTSAIASTSTPIYHLPTASIHPNGTTIFSPPASPVANLTTQPTPPSPVVSPVSRHTSKRARENDSELKAPTCRRRSK